MTCDETLLGMAEFTSPNGIIIYCCMYHKYYTKVQYKKLITSMSSLSTPRGFIRPGAALRYPLSLFSYPFPKVTTRMTERGILNGPWVGSATVPYFVVRTRSVRLYDTLLGGLGLLRSIGIGTGSGPVFVYSLVLFLILRRNYWIKTTF